MRKFPIKRHFGVELEVSNLGIIDNTVFAVEIPYLKKIVSEHTTRKVVAIDEWSQSIDNYYWHIKYDATCGELGKGPGFPRGWEVASFKASGWYDLVHIADIADQLASHGIRVNRHCGLHIHADISDFNVNQAAVLAARWIKVEQWLKQAVPKSRRSNKYCKSLASRTKYKLDQKYTPLEFWEIIRPTNTNPHENAQKRVTLNFVNYVAALQAKEIHYFGEPKRPTVELRLPEGTLDAESIIRWVQLLLLFVTTSKVASMPSNMAPEKDFSNVLAYLGLDSTDWRGELREWFIKRINNYGQPAYLKKVKQKKLDF